MTPEEYADSICKWSNQGMRQSVIDVIAAAVAEKQEQCAKLAEQKHEFTSLDFGEEIASAIRALK